MSSRTEVKARISNRPGGVLRSFALVLCLCLAGPLTAFGQDTPLATGDGFVVTQDDVNALQSYIEETGFFSSDEEHFKVTLRTRVFAEEAMALGLGEPADVGKPQREKTMQLIRLSMRYIRRVLDEAGVDDLVIESYYRSHPEDFAGVLDDGVKEEIRCRIVALKRMDLLNKALERLKEKYNVRILRPEGVES